MGLAIGARQLVQQRDWSALTCAAAWELGSTHASGWCTPAVPYAGPAAALVVAALYLVCARRDAPLKGRRRGPQAAACTVLCASVGCL